MRIDTIRAAGARPANVRHDDDLISAKGVSVVLSRQLILQNIDLSVPKGSFVSLIGPSGCGKSTLLKVLAGLVEPTEGSVSIAGLQPVEAARKRMIGLVFQEANLLPWKNAVDNASMLLSIADKSLSRAQLKARGHEMLELVGLGDSAHKRPHELSGGMRQRVALARALAQASELLLMDEPFAALDAITRDVLHEELTRIWAETGISVLFVTHNVREAVRLAERVVLLSSRPGRIAREWTVGLPRPRRIEDPAVAELSTAITARLREEIRRHGRH